MIKAPGKGVAYALNALSDDFYIDIIYLQYRDGKTIEFIAGALEKDVVEEYRRITGIDIRKKVE